MIKPFRDLTPEAKKFLHETNEKLALEYKKATASRRGEILNEYFELNQDFVTSCWKRWRKEFWPELTQIFVSKWHDAFEGYAPETGGSIFNCYMDRKYKWASSEELKKWLRHESLHEELAPVKQDGVPLERPELVDLGEELGKALDALREKLSEGLEKHEGVVLNDYFFGRAKLQEIVLEAPASWKGSARKENNPGVLSFIQRMGALLVKLKSKVTKEELQGIASLRERQLNNRTNNLTKI